MMYVSGNRGAMYFAGFYFEQLTLGNLEGNFLTLEASIFSLLKKRTPQPFLGVASDRLAIGLSMKHGPGLKIYFLLKMGIFYCYVSLPEGK